MSNTLAMSTPQLTPTPRRHAPVPCPSIVFSTPVRRGTSPSPTKVAGIRTPLRSVPKASKVQLLTPPSTKRKKPVFKPLRTSLSPRTPLFLRGQNHGLPTPETTPTHDPFTDTPDSSNNARTPTSPCSRIRKPPRVPRHLTQAELQARVKALFAADPTASQLSPAACLARRRDLYVSEYQRLLTSQERRLDRNSRYTYKHIVDLADPNSDNRAYRSLLEAYTHWGNEEDNWTLLTWRVYLGISAGSLTVPCLFWSSEEAFHTAAENLSRLRGSRKAIYATTAKLRHALQQVGAFVGWLPLDIGCEHKSKHSSSPSRSPRLRTPASPRSRKPTSPSSRKVGGAGMAALSWTQPIRHVAPSPPRRDDRYHAKYHVLGPDAAFLLYDFDRRVVCFDSKYEPTSRARVKVRREWGAGTSMITHRGQEFTLHALGKARGFGFGDVAEAYPWTGRLHGMVVDAGVKTAPLGMWLEKQVGELAVRARHWS